ncbi:hypothetical protein ABZ413_20925 [Nocardia rhamnosiphila]|uniref:hypothetical protein n=1 Tax=Nocardia rhamnosiphila TaxID=426716 RepID=UPI0033D38EF7
MLALVSTPNEIQLNWQWRIGPTAVNYEIIPGKIPSPENRSKMPNSIHGERNSVIKPITPELPPAVASGEISSHDNGFRIGPWELGRSRGAALAAPGGGAGRGQPAGIAVG